MLTEIARIFVSNTRQLMVITDQKLVLTLPASKMAAFLEMLKQYDFVKVDKLDELVERFIRNAPEEVEMTDEEISDILMTERYGPKP